MSGSRVEVCDSSFVLFWKILVSQAVLNSALDLDAIANGWEFPSFCLYSTHT